MQSSKKKLQKATQRYHQVVKKPADWKGMLGTKEQFETKRSKKHEVAKKMK